MDLFAVLLPFVLCLWAALDGRFATLGQASPSFASFPYAIRCMPPGAPPQQVWKIKKKYSETKPNTNSG